MTCWVKNYFLFSILTLATLPNPKPIWGHQGLSRGNWATQLPLCVGGNGTTPSRPTVWGENYPHLRQPSHFLGAAWQEGPRAGEAKQEESIALVPAQFGTSRPPVVCSYDTRLLQQPLLALPRGTSSPLTPPPTPQERRGPTPEKATLNNVVIPGERPHSGWVPFPLAVTVGAVLF